MVRAEPLNTRTTGTDIDVGSLIGVNWSATLRRNPKYEVHINV